jgi:hypothetical protein
LGHSILEEGIVLDPKKIKYFEGWTTPRNVAEVRPFMGLVGYYQMFYERILKDCASNYILAIERCVI